MEGGSCSDGEKKPPESGGGGGGGSGGGEPKTKRKMKTASQLEVLEKTYQGLFFILFFYIQFCY